MPTNSSKPKLTRKQKAFADELIRNPKLSATRAALATYGKPGKPISYDTAKNISSENLAKPNIQLYLDKHIDKAKTRIVNLVDSDNERIALDASRDILDRTVGKPGAQQQSANLTQINITFGS